MKKLLVLLAVGIFAASANLWADKVNDETGVVIPQPKLQYAGQSDLMCKSNLKVRKPASFDKTSKYYRFFDSKEDRYKNLYFEHND